MWYWLRGTKVLEEPATSIFRVRRCLRNQELTGRDSVLLDIIQTVSGAHSASYPMSTRGKLPNSSVWDVQVINDHLLWMLRMCGITHQYTRVFKA